MFFIHQSEGYDNLVNLDEFGEGIFVQTVSLNTEEWLCFIR